MVDQTEEEEKDANIELTSLLAHTAVKCDVKVNGMKLEAAIDSGCATNIVGSDIAKRIGIPVTKAPPIESTGLASNVTTLGLIKDLPIRKGGTLYPNSVLVQDEDPEKFLLGDAWMVKHKA